MTEILYNVGDRVRVVSVPLSLVNNTQEHLTETVALFERCVGQVLRIEDFNQWGELELNVLDDGSQAPNYCHHTLWIEPECVELAQHATDTARDLGTDNAP